MKLRDVLLSIRDIALVSLLLASLPSVFIGAMILIGYLLHWTGIA